MLTGIFSRYVDAVEGPRPHHRHNQKDEECEADKISVPDEPVHDRLPSGPFQTLERLPVKKQLHLAGRFFFQYQDFHEGHDKRQPNVCPQPPQPAGLWARVGEQPRQGGYTGHYPEDTIHSLQDL